MFLPVLSLALLLAQTYAQYEANWDSLESRPLPDWYDKAKVGIFLHWGVYSVPSYGSEWFWYWLQTGEQRYVDFFNSNYPEGFTYQGFAPQFTAEMYDPGQWADFFQRSGAKYVVLTTKHHEGYTLWPSTYSPDWNSVAVGPHRDLLRDLANEVRKRDLHFGVYYSLLEWYHPVYNQDKANNWETTEFPDNKVIPELKELITNYEPELLWSDGEWEAPDTYWKSTEFLAWLYNESPVRDVIVTNDRWGAGDPCVHGGYLTCEDRYIPDRPLPRKWENAMSIDRGAYGYRRESLINDLLSTQDLINTLVMTVSNGGNILINFGPTKEGTLTTLYQERLLDLGKWLTINGEAIYESQAWTYQNDTVSSNVWYTTNGTAVYAILLEWPADGNVVLGAVDVQDNTQIALLGNENFRINHDRNGDNQPVVHLPPLSAVNGDWAWTLRLVDE